VNDIITDGEDADDELLATAREEARELGWEIIETLGGFCAVPLATKIVCADDLDGLISGLWACLPLSAREPLVVPPLRVVAPADGIVADAPVPDRYQEIGIVRDPDDIGSGG
jgi:hypothetical protein